MRSVSRYVLPLLVVCLCGPVAAHAGDVQSNSPAIPDETFTQNDTQSALEISGGDINVNGIAFETSDAIMYLEYFLVGLAAFETHIEASIAESDINGDGLALTLADWVLMYRVIIGDTIPTPPPPKRDPALAPIQFFYDSTSGTFSLGPGEELAIALIRVPGFATVTPLATLPSGASLTTQDVSGTTVIKLVPDDFATKPVIPTGPLFRIDQHPGINSIMAADWSGETTVVLSYETAPCCIGATGDVNADGSRNLTDLTQLVNHLFVNFEPLTCAAAGNTSGDLACAVNLTDVTALVNLLFVTFDPVADCLSACE